MEDQVKEAEQLGVRAGQLGVHDDRDILDGSFSLVFGSPESWLLNNKWRRMLASTIYQDNLIGIVVDEVHVRSEASKGESAFRESFAKLGELRSIAKEGDLEAILPQAGRAGRHGQPSHAILYNTGQYFKVDEESHGARSSSVLQSLAGCGLVLSRLE
ncbi:unnamed protein product [Boreogadus saida]